MKSHERAHKLFGWVLWFAGGCNKVLRMFLLSEPEITPAVRISVRYFGCDYRGQLAQISRGNIVQWSDLIAGVRRGKFCRHIELQKGPIDTQTIWCHLHQKNFEAQPTKASEDPCIWWWAPYFQTTRPYQDQVLGIKWCLFCWLGHYSPDVPYDFDKFVAHSTFRWCISACVDVYQGLDHHILPSVHYLVFPRPSHPIYFLVIFF